MKWVYKNIDKKPTLSIPSALEVLKTKQGDCNEHAVLMAALCRAAGIPAKICSGIVYLNGSFYYHAWVEVYLNRWVSVDPTLNQFPADVTHIKFIEGEMESQIAVLKLVGKLNLEILEYL
jgi:transglutaminase-like putative cysteine protease